MEHLPITFFRYHENSLLLSWPQEVAPEILMAVRALKQAIEKQYNGVLCTATYASLLLVFPKAMPPIGALTKEIKDLYQTLTPANFDGKHIEIPVCYDLEFALDATFLTKALQLSFKEIVTLHTKAIYRVYGIGFLPGFMYLGGLNSALETPRREQPRIKVPKGAVGIAGTQTGVYPQESPGGWQIIGNCPLDFFNPNKRPPFFAAVGDTISFVSISKSQYKLLRIEQQTGIYTLQVKPQTKTK